MNPALYVTDVFAEGQCEKLGLLTNDKIVTVSGIAISTNEHLAKVLSKLKEKDKTSFKIVVDRQGDIQTFTASTETPLGIRCATKQQKEPEAGTDFVAPKTKCGMVKFFCILATILGWIAIVVGGGMMLYGLMDTDASGAIPIPTSLPGFFIACVGFASIFGAQVSMAVVDIADNTRELLKISQQSSQNK